jgi:hypothetical protein
MRRLALLSILVLATTTLGCATSSGDETSGSAGALSGDGAGTNDPDGVAEVPVTPDDLKKLAALVFEGYRTTKPTTDMMVPYDDEGRCVWPSGMDDGGVYEWDPPKDTPVASQAPFWSAIEKAGYNRMVLAYIGPPTDGGTINLDLVVVKAAVDYCTEATVLASCKGVTPGTAATSDLCQVGLAATAPPAP